jgi:hypothetical protein
MPRAYVDSTHISADEGRQHDSEDCTAAVAFEQELSLMLGGDRLT